MGLSLYVGNIYICSQAHSGFVLTTCLSSAFRAHPGDCLWTQSSRALVQSEGVSANNFVGLKIKIKTIPCCLLTTVLYIQSSENET